MTAAADFGSSLLSSLIRTVGLMLVALGVVLAFMFAFAAAAVIGVMIAGAALAMRLWPRRSARTSEDGVLEARRTPQGWVVETASSWKP